MGTSNFNVRRNSSVFIAFSNEDVSGSFEDCKAEILGNTDSSVDEDDYEYNGFTEEDMYEIYNSRLYDDYRYAIGNFEQYLLDNVHDDFNPTSELDGRSFDKIISASNTVELFHNADIEIRLNVLGEVGYYEGLAIDWEVEIEASSGAIWDSIEDFKNDFDAEYIEEMTDADEEVADFAAPYVKRLVIDAYEKLTGNIDKVFQESQSPKIKRVGGFSDGTSIYKKA